MTIAVIPNSTASRQALRVFEVYLFSLWFLKVLSDPLWELGHLPTSIYQPIGPLVPFGKDLATWIVSEDFLHGLWLGLLATLALSIAPQGFKWKVAGQCSAAVLLTLYQAIVRAVGALSHSEIMGLVPVFILTVYNIFERPSKHDLEGTRHHSKYDYGIPIVLTAIFIACAYLFVGIHRLAIGGLEVFTSKVIVYWLLQKGLDTTYFSYKLGGSILSFPWLKTIVIWSFPFATLLELASPLALVWRSFRPYWLVAMVVFHVSILITMGILFLEPMMLYIVFFDIDKLLALFRPKAPSSGD
jgi:hypothetical protein